MTNCSVRGLQFERVPGTPPPAEGGWIAGRLRLIDGSEIPVSGTVLRCDPVHVSVELDAPGIPEELLSTSLAHVVRPA